MFGNFFDMLRQSHANRNARIAAMPPPPTPGAAAQGGWLQDGALGSFGQPRAYGPAGDLPDFSQIFGPAVMPGFSNFQGWGGQPQPQPVFGQVAPQPQFNKVMPNPIPIMDTLQPQQFAQPPQRTVQGSGVFGQQSGRHNNGPVYGGQAARSFFG